MPHYDESFIHDDSSNQRRNKRSYRVYKQGFSPIHNIFEPTVVLQALEGRKTTVIKKNIRNLKNISINKTKNAVEPGPNKVYAKNGYKNPDIIIDHCPSEKFYGLTKHNDLRNNNVPPLSSCKSLDCLTWQDNNNDILENNCTNGEIRNGISLQNLLDEEKHNVYVSPKVYLNVSDRDLRAEAEARDEATRSSYSVSEVRRRCQQARVRRAAEPPRQRSSLESGVYRRINCDVQPKTKQDPHDGEGGIEPWSGHRGSLRGANKLARRARSFKDDLLERISAMRSPGQPHHQPHLSSGYRSHSPLSPKMRGNLGAKPPTEEGELTPAKELEQLVNKVKFGLKHFCDVITKKKLEMLPGNSNIVLDDIANIHRAIKPYCSRSASLGAAVQRLCSALAQLIRLCDEATAAPTEDPTVPALQPQHVTAVVEGVHSAVQEVTTMALQYMSRPALSPRPALVSGRPPSQRNSLPDIPLTPKERSLLTGEGGAMPEGGIRASHSSESVLDAPDPPPPKPPRPNRKVGAAPPLPPKRKPNENSLGLCTDRVSLQSHSSGSLDSMLNVSNDDEVRAIMDHTSQSEEFFTQPTSDILGVCSCPSEGRTSLDSSSASESQLHGAHSHTNHNRFSNESGFASMNQNSAVWSDSKSSAGFTEFSHADNTTLTANFSHLYNYNANSVFESSDTVHAEVKCTAQTFERRVNIQATNIQANCVQATNVTSNFTNLLQPNGGGPTLSLSSMSSTEESDGAPPALPVKTRRSLRAELHHHFPNVEIRQTSGCALHGDIRPHTLADHHPPRPPPLPLKKKHMFQSVAYSVMAYMEMFGKSNHPPNSLTADQLTLRHSIHTYNLASNNHTGSPSAQHLSYQHVQHKSIAQSLTLHHFGTPQLSSSEDSVNLTPAGGASPVPPAPPAPPALPPKMSKFKQLALSAGAMMEPVPIVIEPRPNSHNSVASHDDSLNNSVVIEEYISSPGPGKFPLDAELDQMVTLTPSPTPSKVESVGERPVSADVSVTNISGTTETEGEGDGETDIVLQSDVSGWLLNKTPDEKGADIRGGHPDALIVQATKSTKDFAYPEAFLATYRTWVTPQALVSKLIRRARHLRSRPHELRPTLALFTRVVADLTTADLDNALLQEIMEFVYWLVCCEELPMAKELRQKLLDKQRTLQALAASVWEGYGPFPNVSLRRETLLDFKASELAEQMTLLDAALFTRITTAEVLSWPRDQSEETSPNLTRFTEHFNKMSYWARTRILEQEEARDRERYVSRLLKVMKHLRKINNFNSYLALLSALDCPPVRRLGWPRALLDSIRDHTSLIDSTASFRCYRQVLAETHPPCIPYLGLVLQDLTFVHIGNSDLLPDGSINFSKRWQQYQIIQNMKKFYQEQYTFKKNESIIAMFNGFEDVLSEEAMWQISESIKPRGGRNKVATNNVATTVPVPGVPLPTA